MLTVFAAVIVLGYRFFQLIAKHAVEIYFFDQWDFLAPLFRGDAGFFDLFRLQHGPHRQGIGLIATKVLYSVTHWSTRAESFMIGGCIFAAMLLAFVLKRKLFGKISWTDIAIPLIFLTLQQYETLFGTPNASHSAFPLLLVLTYCLALLQQRRWLRYTLVLAINALLIYTGMGLFMGAVTIAVFALELRSAGRAALLSLVIACATLASFFIDYRFSPAVSCYTFPHSNPLEYPQFIAISLITFLGVKASATLLTILGSVILAIALTIFIRAAFEWSTRKEAQPMTLIVAVLIGYSLLFIANTAVGRVCLGLPSAAQPSRYTTLLIPAFFGIYLYLLTLCFRHIVLLLFLCALIPGIAIQPRGAHWYSNGKREWLTCYQRTKDIGQCDASTRFPIYPDPARTNLQWKLDYLKAHKLSFFADNSPQLSE